MFNGVDKDCPSPTEKLARKESLKVHIISWSMLKRLVWDASGFAKQLIYFSVCLGSKTWQTSSVGNLVLVLNVFITLTCHCLEDDI